MATLNLDLVDSQGRVTSKEIHMAASVDTVAEAQGAADDVVAAWPGVSDLGITGISVSFPLTLTPVAAVTGSNIDEATRFSLQMATGVGKENYRIPGPPRTAGDYDFIAGGVADVEDAGVQAWFALFATGDVLRIGVNSLRAVSDVLSGYLERK